MPVITPYIVNIVDNSSSTPTPVAGGVPEELSSSAEVLAVLSAENVGKVYLYTGQDGNYDQNCYYIVEEVE